MPVHPFLCSLSSAKMSAGDIRLSKTLAYILRHGAIKKGITMRPDGYCQVCNGWVRKFCVVCVHDVLVPKWSDFRCSSRWGATDWEISDSHE